MLLPAARIAVRVLSLRRLRRCREDSNKRRRDNFTWPFDDLNNVHCNVVRYTLTLVQFGSVQFIYLSILMGRLIYFIRITLCDKCSVNEHGFKFNTLPWNHESQS